MKTRRTGKFQYIRIPGEKKRLFCLQESISGFAWMRFFITDSLNHIVRFDSQISGQKLLVKQMRGRLGQIKRNIRFLSLFIGYKLGWFKSEVVVELPCYGQLCVPIHRGHKVFDFDRKIVIKKFDYGVHSSIIREEIDVLKGVSRFEFAPSLKEWNIEAGWYEEEYVQGVLDSSYTPMNSATVQKKFSDEIIQPLIQIMLSQKPVDKNSLEYVLDMARKSSLQAASGTTCPNMISFIDAMMDRIRTEGNRPIYLVFTHGDFVPANMLMMPEGMKIIDWEGAGERSALFDFYTYFFYRPANRNIAVSEVIQETREALPLFIAEIAKRDQDIARSVVSMEHIYRWTYYMEWIYRLLDRGRTDTNLDIPYYTRMYLRAFTEYEELLASKEV